MGDRPARGGLAIIALGGWLPPAYGGIPPEDTRHTATAYPSQHAARGHHVLLCALTAHGYPDAAHAIATSRTFPSWGFRSDNGADPTWEMWPPDSRSRDHYRAGAVYGARVGVLGVHRRP